MDKKLTGANLYPVFINLVDLKTAKIQYIKQNHKEIIITSQQISYKKLNWFPFKLLKKKIITMKVTSS